MINDAPCAGWVSTRSLTRAAVVKDSRPAWVGTPAGHAAMLPASGLPPGSVTRYSIPSPIAGAARRDDLNEAAQTALGVLLGEPGNLGFERRFGLALDEIRARPINEQQNSQDRDDEDQDIKSREAESMGSEQPLRITEKPTWSGPRSPGGQQKLLSDHWDADGPDTRRQ